MSDYLFDKQGEPDPELDRLEQLLAPMGYRGAAPQLPARRPRRLFVVAVGLSALAAALLLLLVAKPWRPAPPSWAATVRDGVATRDGHAISGAVRLPVGAWLETQSGRVRLEVADIGTVELAAHTRARIVATGPALHELELARGTLSARIDAPPRRFVVATPRARMIDLGCAFELTVDEAGRGRLVVTAGRVAVSDGGAREVVVDAGARVELTERGPGAPYVPTAELPSVPTAAQPHAATPTTQPQPTPPAPAHATKPPRHPTRGPSAPSSAHQPTKAAQPPRQSAPTKIEHDSLKELERSAP